MSQSSSSFLFETDDAAVRNTIGAMLAGGFVCIFLSGIVSMQAYLYFRVYSKDKLQFRITVGSSWLLDILHTVMVCISNWMYLITQFGNREYSDVIVWAIAATICLTGFITFITHSFFTHRIYALSHGNLFIALPLGLLAVLRVALGIVSTAEMIILKSFAEFIAQYKWVLTLALIVSAVLDVFICIGLCYFLRKNKSGFSTMDQVIDSLVLYSIESGGMTCIMTILTLVFWILMTDNLIFLGLHFTIAKLYSNSLLATLNSRKTLQVKSQASSDKAREYAMPVRFPNLSRGRTGTREEFNPSSTMGHVEISVTKTTRREVDGETINEDVIDRTRSIRLEPIEDDRSSLDKCSKPLAV